MNVNVYGLGNVGAVIALGLLKRGSRVTGVEVDPKKIESLNAGKMHFHEPGLQELLTFAGTTGRWNVVLDGSGPDSDPAFDHIAADVHLVCVGTPSAISGRVDLSQVQNVFQKIAKKIKDSKTPALVILKSTVPPGTSRELLKVLEERSGKKRGTDFDFYFSPEFLREGMALNDFMNPSLAALGSADGQLTFPMARDFFASESAVHFCTYEDAELLKYACNHFHALKVVFANEMGALSKVFGGDSDRLLSMFLSDKKLNISEKYLRPGFPFGGPCLNKDLRGLENFSAEAGLQLPLLRAVRESNEEHLHRFQLFIEPFLDKRTLFLGVAFKAATDDIRESPLMRILQRALQTPFYRRKPSLSVLDRPRVLAQLETMALPVTRYAERDWSRALGEAECVVLGPYLPDEASMPQWIKALNDFSGPIIDLGWHSAWQPLKAKSQAFL